MKNGLLIYTSEDAGRNEWFIAQLCKEAKSEGISLRLSLCDGQTPEQLMQSHPDFIINRSRLASFSCYAEQQLRVPCFNTAQVTEITNDKYKTYCHFGQKHVIPMAKTQWIHQLEETVPALPLIAKPADGHGGQGVQLIHSIEELNAYAVHSPKQFLLQEPMQFGWDVRVYILGNAVYAAVLRTSETDIRSNYSLGGQVQLFTVSEEMCALIQQILDIMPLDFAGIDFLRHPDGHLVLGEIEDAVGSRMLYQLTDKKPVQDYIRYISKALQAN
ncbi:MAG: ATP-grasp domain-containing protein [Oscillospiraceae bacterium]|nr:ATP-grasp domain-containing protein [Oscillospiraceae bacterium]